MNNQELNHLTLKEVNKNCYKKQAKHANQTKHTNQEYIRRVTFTQIMNLTMKNIQG